MDMYADLQRATREHITQWTHSTREHTTHVNTQHIWTHNTRDHTTHVNTNHTWIVIKVSPTRIVIIVSPDGGAEASLDGSSQSRSQKFTWRRNLIFGFRFHRYGLWGKRVIQTMFFLIFWTKLFWGGSQKLLDFGAGAKKFRCPEPEIWVPVPQPWSQVAVSNGDS